MTLPKLDVPTYELSLPSNGKKIKYRPFLVREHKILLTLLKSDESEVERVVRELVNACTFNTLDSSKLPHFDIEYIFLKIRSKSIGEVVNVTLTCKCGNKIDTSYSIEDLKIEKSDAHTTKFMINDVYGVELSYPLLKDVINLYESSDETKIIDLVVKCIKGIYNNEQYWEAKDQSVEEVAEFVNSLTKDQFDKIEEFFTTAPKIVQPVEADCPVCKHHNITQIQGLSNFFV